MIYRLSRRLNGLSALTLTARRAVVESWVLKQVLRVAVMVNKCANLQQQQQQHFGGASDIAMNVS